jgi:hypothetical protein
MNPTRLRAVVEQRVRAGMLPRYGLTLPAMPSGQSIPFILGPGGRRSCSACDEPKADMRVGELAFHTGCKRIWAEVWERLAEKSE